MVLIWQPILWSSLVLIYFPIIAIVKQHFSNHDPLIIVSSMASSGINHHFPMNIPAMIGDFIAHVWLPMKYPIAINHHWSLLSTRRYMLYTNTSDIYIYRSRLFAIHHHQSPLININYHESPLITIIVTTKTPSFLPESPKCHRPVSRQRHFSGEANFDLLASTDDCIGPYLAMTSGKSSCWVCTMCY